MTVRTLTPSLLAVATLAACGPDAGDPATRYADRGDHAVGYTELTHALDGGTDLSIKAWYPADAHPDDEEILTYQVEVQLPGFGGAVMPFEGQALRDAPVDASDGPHPLVVLSHAYSMNPEWYAPLAEHLASQGFVVLGPQHTESDWAADVVWATTARPREVSATIDLAQDGALDGLIDVEHVAVVGHSYGGYTALASAGARVDLDQLAERCGPVQEPFLVDYFCTPFLDNADALAAGFGLGVVPELDWPSLGDERVDAIVPMAGDAYLFSPASLEEVTVPALLIGGTADTGTPWDWGTGLAEAHLGGEHVVVVGFQGGEHMLPVTSCENLPWTDSLPQAYRDYFCEDPAWDKQDAQDTIHHVTTAFLRTHLLDRERAADALDPEVYAIEGLEVRVRGE